MVPSAIVNKGFHVVREIGVQCLASGLHTSGSAADRQRLFRKAGAIVQKPLQLCFRDPWSAMPKPPAEAFRGELEQHRNSSETRYLDQALNGGLDMSDAHRDVPPVEDMFHLPVATHGIPYEFGRASSPSAARLREMNAGTQAPHAAAAVPG